MRSSAGGDTIGRVVIMDIPEQEINAFDDIMLFLQKHPELKRWELDSEPVLSLPELSIYPDRRKVYHDKQEIELTTKEFDLLCLLVVNKGRVLTHGQIYQMVWKEEPLGNENIAVGSNIRSMRRKLFKAFPKSPFIINCMRNVGYSFDIRS